MRPEWHAKSGCSGKGDLFFAVENLSAQHQPRQIAVKVAKAKMICDSCPVFAECEEFVLKERPSHGIWIGMTAAERRSWMRRKHRRKGAV